LSYTTVTSAPDVIQASHCRQGSQSRPQLCVKQLFCILIIGGDES